MEMPGDYSSAAGHVQTPLAYGTRDLCSTQGPSALQVAITPSHWPGGPPTITLLGEPPSLHLPQLTPKRNRGAHPPQAFEQGCGLRSPPAEGRAPSGDQEAFLGWISGKLSC